jgi:hypothetical protein
VQGSLVEAGALSKNFGKTNVCTILFNLDSTDFTGPLTSFQATKFEKTDFKKLLTTINNTGSDAKLDLTVLNDVFEMWWPKLETEIKEILKNHVALSPNTQRSERDILEEILELTRISTKRFPRQSGVLKHALYRLVETFFEMQYQLGFEDEQNLMLIEDARRALKDLCMEIDAPELYERYMASRFIEKKLMPKTVTFGDTFTDVIDHNGPEIRIRARKK